jgi:predicted nucleic acid-binding protein
VILVLDSSALIKLYVLEPESPTVDQAVDEAATIAVSSLVMPEAAHAFTRRAADGVISSDQASTAFRALLEDWPRYERFDVIDHIAKEAAVIARSKRLKGADAVQLATAALLSRERRGVRFLAFDEALNTAASGLVKIWKA